MKKLGGNLVEKFEQLEFELTKQLGHSTMPKQNCFDNNGNEIKIGDYVIAVRGEAKINCVEGFVEDIVYCNDNGAYITVVSCGGKILERNGNPFFYEVLSH